MESSTPYYDTFKTLSRVESSTPYHDTFKTLHHNGNNKLFINRVMNAKHP